MFSDLKLFFKTNNKGLLEETFTFENENDFMEFIVVVSSNVEGVALALENSNTGDIKEVDTFWFLAM